MNTNSKKRTAEESISKAQEEVWKWKQKAFEDLQKIPSQKRMEHIRKNTQSYVDAILASKKNKKLSNKTEE